MNLVRMSASVRAFLFIQLSGSSGEGSIHCIVLGTKCNGFGFQQKPERAVGPMGFALNVLSWRHISRRYVGAHLIYTDSGVLIYRTHVRYIPAEVFAPMVFCKECKQ